jgi:TolB protein
MEPGPIPTGPLTPDPATGPARRPPTPLLAGIGVALVVAVVVLGAIWVLPSLTGGAGPPAPSGGAAASIVAVAPSTVASVSPSVRPSPAATSASPTSTTLPGGPFAAAGSMAVLGNDGSLSLVEATGRSTVLAPAGDQPIGFPAWSPDGSRIAAIRSSPDNTILVFDAKRAASGQPVEPVVIFRSPVIGPFYLSWTPDGRSVSYLAEDPDGLSLRVAPADGSGPLDGTGPGARIQSGNPFYFDWIGPGRLLAHIGTGPFAFLGEIPVGGASSPPDLKAPGDFRSAVVSHDGRFVSYVRTATDGSSAVVVAGRDGSNERTMPVFGMAAVTFDPVGDTIASIGPIRTPDTAFAIPLGPLRLIDPTSGKVRTLLDGSVVSFWWSPDGKTIAALRVQPVAGATSAVSPSPPASPVPSPSTPQTEVRLLFVDVASGNIGSQRVVQPGQLFIDQFLTYFDQYALSHSIWAPDSSSLLMPVIDTDGTTRIAVMFRNDDPPRPIEGAIGFWSP